MLRVQWRGFGISRNNWPAVINTTAEAVRTVGDLKSWAAQIVNTRDIEIRWDDFILDSKQSIHRLIRKLATISIHRLGGSAGDSDSDADLGKRIDDKAQQRPRDRISPAGGTGLPAQDQAQEPLPDAIRYYDCVVFQSCTIQFGGNEVASQKAIQNMKALITRKPKQNPTGFISQTRRPTAQDKPLFDVPSINRLSRGHKVSHHELTNLSACSNVSVEASESEVSDYKQHAVNKLNSKLGRRDTGDKSQYIHNQSSKGNNKKIEQQKKVVLAKANQKQDNSKVQQQSYSESDEEDDDDSSINETAANAMKLQNSQQQYKTLVTKMPNLSPPVSKPNLQFTPAILPTKQSEVAKNTYGGVLEQGSKARQSFFNSNVQVQSTAQVVPIKPTTAPAKNSKVVFDSSSEDEDSSDQAPPRQASSKQPVSSNHNTNPYLLNKERAKQFDITKKSVPGQQKPIQPKPAQQNDQKPKINLNLEALAPKPVAAPAVSEYTDLSLEHIKQLGEGDLRSLFSEGLKIRYKMLELDSRTMALTISRNFRKAAITGLRSQLLSIENYFDDSGRLL